VRRHDGGQQRLLRVDLLAQQKCSVRSVDSRSPVLTDIQCLHEVRYNKQSAPIVGV
jgi:hypothetical protein